MCDLGAADHEMSLGINRDCLSAAGGVKYGYIGAFYRAVIDIKSLPPPSAPCIHVFMDKRCLFE